MSKMGYNPEVGLGEISPFKHDMKNWQNFEYSSVNMCYTCTTVRFL